MAAAVVEITLTRAQAEFCRSRAPFRALVGGRGAGKTHVGAYDLLRRAEPEALYGVYAPTYRMLLDATLRSFLAQARALCFLREWHRGDMRATLGNYAEVIFRSLDEPERARGPNLAGGWIDEASLVPREAFDIIIASLRGEDGRMGWLSATFTPRGRAHWTYDVFASGRPDTLLVKAPTRTNPFLPAEFYDLVRGRYTERLARQELEGEFVADVEGALWNLSALDALRVCEAPALRRVVVGVDPSATRTGDEAGIVVAGLGANGHGYVLADDSLHASPHGWGSRAVQSYHAHGADRLVAEVNNGGEMVELTIRTVDPKVSYKAVHASRGKRTRAEPVAALYEQGRVHHVGVFGRLEDEMVNWTPEDADSPNRMDALVWALTELMLNRQGGLLR